MGQYAFWEELYSKDTRNQTDIGICDTSLGLYLLTYIMSKSSASL